MASIVSRIFSSFDRIPTPLACSMTMVIGCIEAIALFINTVPATAPWYLRVVPFAAFGVIATLGVIFIVVSRPVVMHRETGSLTQRALLHLQHAGRIATLHAVMASLVVVPALIVTGKFGEPPQTSTPIVPAKPIESASVDEAIPAASVQPSAVEDKPAPTAPITTSTPSTSPPGADPGTNGEHRGPMDATGHAPPDRPNKPPPAPDDVIQPRPVGP